MKKFIIFIQILEEYESIFADEETIAPTDDYFEPMPVSYHPRSHYGRLNYFNSNRIQGNLNYSRNGIPYFGFYPRNSRYIR